MTKILLPSDKNVQALEALERSLFSDSWSLDSLFGQLSSPYGLSLGVFRKDILVSYGLFQIIGEEAEVLRIGTDPAFLRKGLATAVLREFEQISASRGVKTIFLEVRSQNAAAKSLYEKEGYRLIGRREDYYKNPRDDALVYQKKKTETK